MFQAMGRGARGTQPVSARPPGFSRRHRTSGPPSSGRLKTSTTVNRAHPRPGEGSPCCLAAHCILVASAAVMTFFTSVLVCVRSGSWGGGSGSGGVLSATLSTAASCIEGFRNAMRVENDVIFFSSHLSGQAEHQEERDFRAIREGAETLSSIGACD